MITSFGNKLARDLYDDKHTRETRKLPAQLRRIARRKLLYLHEAVTLEDLRVPPGNRLEALGGDRSGYFSIRINRQFRVVFSWKHSEASDVTIEDYH